jgi:hypothetical protein
MAAQASCAAHGIRLGRGLENPDVVGAQWELRWALSRRDQRVRAYDGYARAYVDRRFAPG